MGEVRAGHTLGRYELLVPIALGGMASVWAARTSGQLPRLVAVKLLRAELSDDPDFEAMFLDEATLVSQIHHPNVAETIDVGEEDGVLYQVMELIDGEPLNLVLRESKARGGVPLAVALRIVGEAALGLHAAHELRDRDGKLVGLVHRDVSPQNILVGYDGAVKIVDFGVAKAASNLQRTKVGQIKGKFAYMSPEQAGSEPVDRRSDVFTLGIVFYQLLTGRHPFFADNEPAMVRRICDKAPVEPPRTLTPAIPEDVERIVLRALAKPRDERFASMAELRRAIEQAATRLATADELAALMQKLLGPRGARRRAAIQEAMQIARESSSHADDPPALQSPPGAGVTAARAVVAPARAAAERAASEPRSAPLPARPAPRWPLVLSAVVLAALVAFAGVYLLRPSPRGAAPLGADGEGAAPAPRAGSIKAAILRASRAASSKLTRPPRDPRGAAP
ncbi:serine/threonine protein kinase [Sorangium cellulosum]|uniref:Serine/threonine protein kinase n=1 Tax=Sorangium cellulosum TaxID=56 RepID=A0A2L0F6R2_SORCE|nr:serine/threonine-protein kinase [Sorangium cellulosum]AUX47233.1 serine/threonine protein kinase [Sorangium cellulosum]